MRVFGRTLYAQIATLYLVLVLLFCAVAIVLTARLFDAFLGEIGQRLNRDLAAHLVERLEPALASGLHSDTAMHAVRRVREINPALDIYVLDGSGRVIGAYTEAMPARGARIDLAPVHAFLEDGAMLPIRAQDPADPAETKVFSAAPMQSLGSVDAYLYIILHGSPLDVAGGMFRNSYIVRGVTLALTLLLVSVIAVGLVLFSLLTRRFRHLTKAVHSISAGDYAGRVPIDADDEIGRLGKAVNEMAGMIQAQVEELHRTDEARRTLVANLSHDFRTPLTSLRGYAQRLASGGERLDTPAREEALDAIASNTRQLEHLAAQLAALSLLDGHGQPAEIEAFSLSELMQDVILKFGPSAAQQQVALDVSASELPDVCGDIGLIERVLSNLIDNALSSTLPGGQVLVTAAATASGTDSGSVRLVVRDTGCGIAEKDLPLITRRFYRTERARQTRPTGTGLGLAIAREILELHDTELELSSVVGVGTEASFQLRTAS